MCNCVKRPGGFTFMEILMCMGIIGLAAVLGLYAVMHAHERSRRLECRGNIQMLYHAVTEYAIDNDLAVGATVTVAQIIPRYIARTNGLVCSKTRQTYGPNFILGRTNMVTCPTAEPGHSWTPDESIGF